MLFASAVDRSAERSPRRWILLGFLTLAMFFCYVHRQTLAIAAPSLMKDLGLNQAAIGLLLSVFFWSYSLAQVPAGWLIDRYGMGRVYAVGFFLWTAAVTLTSITSTIAALIALQLLLGMGQGVAFPASARAVSHWFVAGERGGATGLYLSGNRLGQAAIGAIGPALIAAYGWRLFFLDCRTRRHHLVGGMAVLDSVVGRRKYLVGSSERGHPALFTPILTTAARSPHGRDLPRILCVRLRLVSVTPMDACVSDRGAKVRSTGDGPRQLPPICYWLLIPKNLPDRVMLAR